MPISDIPKPIQDLLFGSPDYEDLTNHRVALNLQKTPDSNDFRGSLYQFFAVDAELIRRGNAEEIIAVVGDKLDTITKNTEAFVRRWKKLAREAFLNAEKSRGPKS